MYTQGILINPAGLSEARLRRAPQGEGCREEFAIPIYRGSPGSMQESHPRVRDVERKIGKVHHSLRSHLKMRYVETNLQIRKMRASPPKRQMNRRFRRRSFALCEFPR